MPDGYSIEHKTLFDKLDKIYKQTMWDKVTHDFGQIKPNTTVKAEFTYNGKAQIKQVTASCGCTIPEKPEEPIAPGNTGKIKATFDSRGRAGMNQKVITVVANTKETIHTLIFDVDVENPQYAK
jgi:hypothetical protein